MAAWFRRHPQATIEPLIYFTHITSSKTSTSQGSSEGLGDARLVLGCTENRVLRYRVMLQKLTFTQTPALMTYLTDTMDDVGTILTNVDNKAGNWLASNTGMPDDISHSNTRFLRNLEGSKKLLVTLHGKQLGKSSAGVIKFYFDLTAFPPNLRTVKKAVCTK